MPCQLDIDYIISKLSRVRAHNLICPLNYYYKQLGTIIRVRRLRTIGILYHVIYISPPTEMVNTTNYYGTRIKLHRVL